MARRSLKPQLNQIRAWVQQGRTDAWIAHQLEVSAAELREFRKQHDLTADDAGGGSQEVDLRDEIEAEVEAATEEAAKVEEAEVDAEDDGQAEDEEKGAEENEGDSEEGDEAAPRRRRRRGRRGGRGRRKELEGTFDHGEQDGYGLWFDASIKDNPVYTEHWAGKREITVRIEADQIVIRPAGAGEPSDSSDSSDSED